MLHNHCMLLFLLPICVILIELCFANAYAQLADTMLCADESCSETISQGEARLAYRPKDDKFLNFKKGDVVIVKSKNAGKRSQLWGGEVMGSDRFGFFPSSFVKELIVTVKSPENSVSVQDFLNKHRSIMTKSPYANLVGENQKITIEKPKTHKMDPKDAISSSVSTDRQQAKVASDSLDSKGSENANVEKMLKENDSNANENTNINGIINDTEDTQEKSVTINQEEQDATMSVNKDIDGNSQAPSNKIKSDTVITESKANGRQQEPVLEDFKSDVGDIPPDIAILLGKTGKQEMLKKSDTTVETINTNEINKNNIKNSKESSSARMISEEVDSVKDHTLENSEESIKHDVLAATNPIASDETGPSNLSSVTNENFEGENGNDSQTSKDQEKENKEKLINQANAAGSTDLKEAQITDSDGEAVVDEGHKSQQEHSKLNDSDAIIDRDSQEKENANATTDSNSEAFVRKQIEASDHKDSNAIRSADDASGGKQEHDVSSTDVVHNHDDGQTAGGTADGDPNVNSETVVEKRKGNEEELINQENRIHGGDINNVPPVTDVEGAKENVSIQDENETITERNTDDDVNERKEDDIKRTDHDHEIHDSENSIESQSAEDNVDGNTHSKDVIDPNKENEDAITEKVNEVSEEAVSTVTSAIGTETEQVSEDATPEKLKEVPEEAASTVTGDIGTETKQIDAVVNDSVIQNPYGNENATETTGDDADKNRSIVIETKKEGDITDKKNEIDGKTVTVKESSDGSEGNQLDDVLKNDMQNLDRDLTPEENTYTDNESQAAIETIKEDENEQPDQKNVLHSNLIITAGDQNEPKQKDALKQENEDDMKGEDLSKAELKAHKFQDKESNKFQERLKEDKFFTSKSDNTTFREATEKMEDSYAKSDESSIGYNTSDSTDITAEHLIEASHTKQAEYSKSVDGAVGDASEFDSTTSTQMHNTKESKLVENDSKFAPDRNKEVSDPNTAEETKVILKDGLHDGFGMCNYGDDKLLKWFFGVNLNPSLSSTSRCNIHVDKKTALNELTRITANSESDSYSHCINDILSKQTTDSHINVKINDLKMSSSPKFGSSQIGYSDLCYDPLLKWFFQCASFYSVSTRCGKKEDICFRTNDGKYENFCSSKAVDEQYSDLKYDPMLKWLFLNSVSSIGKENMQNKREKYDLRPLDNLLEWFLKFKTVDTTPAIKMIKTLNKPQRQDNKPSLLHEQYGHTDFLEDPLLRYFFQIKSKDVTPVLEQNSEASVENLKFKTSDDLHPKLESVQGSIEQDSDKQRKGYSDLASDPLLRWMLAHSSSRQQCSDIKGYMKRETLDKPQKQDNEPLLLHQRYGRTDFLEDPVLRYFFQSNSKDVTPAFMQKPETSVEDFKFKTSNDLHLKSESVEGSFEQDSDKQRKGCSDLASDPLLRWMLDHSSSRQQCSDIKREMKRETLDKSQKQDNEPLLLHQRYGRTDFLEDPLLRYFFQSNSKDVTPAFMQKPETSVEDLKFKTSDDLHLKSESVQGSFEQDSDQQRKGYSDLASDPLLRWVLAHSSSRQQCSDIKREMNMKQNDQMIIEEEHYTDLLKDPLLQWFVESDRVSHKHSSAINCCLMSFPQSTGKPYSDMIDDPLLRWFFQNKKDHCPAFITEPGKNVLPQHDYTSLLDHPILCWFVRRKDETYRSKSLSDTLNLRTDLMRDPLLKWFISVHDNILTEPIKEVSWTRQRKYYSDRTEDPLLKFFYNSQQFPQSESSYQSVPSDYDIDYGILGSDNGDCEFVYSNPLIQKTFILGKKEEIQESNEADHASEYISNPMHDKRTCTDLTVDNLLKWFVPTSSEALKAFVRDDREQERQYSQQQQNQDKQSVLFDDPLLRWFYIAMQKKDDFSIEVNMNSSTGFIDAEKDFNNVESKAVTNSMEFHSKNIDNKDTCLRKQIEEFKKVYEIVSGFRTIVSDTMDIIKMLRKNKPSVVKKYHSPGKIMRKQVITLEEDILQQVKILSEALYNSNVQKMVDITEDFFLEKSKILEAIKSKIEILKSDIHSLHEAVSSELYPNLELDDEDKMILSNKDVAKIELDKLQEILVGLDEKVSKKTSESEQVIQKLTDEAEKFKLKISDLESAIALKNKEEGIHKMNFEVIEKKISEKLVQIEAVIGKTQTEEQANTALEETKQMKEQLQQIKSYIKETKEAGKPHHDRIYHLEKELRIHRVREIEKARKYKHDAAKLHFKIQSLENQLETNDGNKLLGETMELQEKFKILENELSMKADKGKQAKEVELEERLNSLEKELGKQLNDQTLLSKEKEVNDLHDRLTEMEEKLHSKFASESSAPQYDNKIDEGSHAIGMKKVQSRMSRREILSLLDSLFLSTPNTDSRQYRNQSRSISEVDSEFFTDVQNNDIDSKCIIKPAQRIACGSKVLSEKFCKALQCCWYPVPDDLSTPPCYFSLLQMTDATSKPSNQNDQSPSKLETLSSKDDSSEEDYKPLHEGKVVNWDESLQSTKKPSEGLGWDETIGKTNENKTLDDHDVIPRTREETGNQLTTKSDVDSTTDILAAANTEKDDFPSANDADASKDSKTKDEQHLMSTGSGEEEKDSTTVTKTSDAINADSDRNIVDEQFTVSPDEASEITVANTSYERTEDAGHTETNTQESFIEESRPEGQSDEMHVESLPLRILLLLSKFPYDMQYVMEPFFKLWVSLLPEEYQNDVHGVSWMVIGSTMFVGCLFIWMFLLRMKSSSRKRKEAQAAETVKELRLQLEAVIQEKLEKENELKEKQCEVESKREELDSANQNTSLLTTEKNNMQRSFNEFSSQYEQLRQTLESLTGELDQKNNYISELLDKHQSLEKARDTQQQLLSDHEKSLSNLENHVKETEERKRGMEATINKQKEKIKALEKAKGDTKKEGKSWKDQAEKLNEKILLLEERLNAEVTENEQSKQEIDVLKDCLLQLRGVQEALGSDEDGEMSVENQKEKLKALIDVYEIKTVLKQTEAQKAQKTYELEAERKSRTEIEAKISELEGEIQCSDAMKNKLEHDKQLLESKLAVMQEFYAKREVEIQSKLGMEQTKLETNSYLLEERQQQQMELVKQLEIYKNMNEGSKRQYEDAERKHKQEIVAFEKKAHENWLACREAERKHDEASKQINQLHMELADLQHRLHIEREPIIRPRPERHGPPGGPPPFGPSRRGIPPSPVHFRNGPPDTGRRSPMISRRPPSPGNSLNEDLRSQSPTGRPRPDRPPSAQSLPPADRRPPSHGPFIPPASHGPPGRGFGPYREGIPPRPLLHRPPYPHLRGPPDSRHRDPAFSSPYMDRPTIALSKSPGPNFTNNTQGSLHAPPPVITGSDRSALRNDGAPPMSYSTPTNEGPPLSEHKPGASGPNPFRRV